MVLVLVLVLRRWRWGSWRRRGIEFDFRRLPWLNGDDGVTEHNRFSVIDLVVVVRLSPPLLPLRRLRATLHRLLEQLLNP